MPVNVPFYTPRIPISGGGGRIQDLSEDANRNKLLLADAIAKMMQNIQKGKRKRQYQQQFQQVSPILSRGGDRQANIQEALRSISEAKRPTGISGAVDWLNPFAPTRGRGSALEQSLLEVAMKEPRAPTIAGMRAGRAAEVGAIPGTKEFERIARGPEAPMFKEAISDRQRNKTTFNKVFACWI